LDEYELLIMQKIESIPLKRLTCLAIGLLLYWPVKSQRLQRDTTQERSVQLLCQTGIIGTGIKNDSVNLPGAIYNAIDIRFGWKSRRKGLYPTLYRHPTFGLGFYAATFNRPEIGSPYALYGFVDFPFWNKNQKWQWLYSMAMGLSYNFNPYDSEKNPLNTLIGSRQNAYIHFHSRVKHQISNRISFGMGLGFTHFSNGAYRLPNTGLNKISWLLGVEYRTSRDKSVDTDQSLPAYSRKKQSTVYWSNGLKNFRPGGAIYWKTGFGFSRTWSIDHRYRIGLGTDLFFRSGTPNLTNSMNTKENAWSSGIYAAWEWVITERLYMPLNIGTYLHDYTENGEKHRLYERIGLRYHINHQIYMGISIKAHLQSADFTEWTIGFRPGLR
jgi:hypothetical protein